MVQVIDTSVAVKWFVEETGRPAALELLKQLFEKPQDFVVPELFYFELVHVFNMAFPEPSETDIYLLDSLFKMGIVRLSMTEELSHGIRHFQKMGLSGYDAAYVAVARMVKGTWLTFDKKAHKRIAPLKLSRLL